jgi:signal transduction histidine kinase
MADSVIIAAFIALVATGLLVWRERTNQRELKRLRDDLAEANARLAERSRLATVGEMVSDLAQELKSPLQDVLGNTELMIATSTRSGGLAQSTEELHEIRDGVERAAGIVRNLVAFTETVSLSSRWHDVKDIVDRALMVRQHERDARGIRVHQEPLGRLPMVYVDGRQLEKVIAALVMRSAGAAEDATAPAPVTVRISITRVSTPEDHVVFTIDDNGPVMSEDQLGGAGLAASRRVVEAHGGSLAVGPLTSGPGVRAIIELPVATMAIASRTAQEKPRSWTESSISSTSTVKSTSTS